MMNDIIIVWMDFDFYEMVLFKLFCFDSFWFVDIVVSWYWWILSRSGDLWDCEE